MEKKDSMRSSVSLMIMSVTLSATLQADPRFRFPFTQLEMCFAGQLDPHAALVLLPHIGMPELACLQAPDI